MMLGFAVASARQEYNLNDDWRFFFKNENSSDGARHVNLPHTWNTDVPSVNGGFVQTMASYHKVLNIPAQWEGKRLFLRFAGVQSVADVILNGVHVCEHRGGWTAFTCEITQQVRFGEENSLLVQVNNAYQNDVLPTGAELNLYGGIYRDVSLIVTEQTTVSPVYYGADAVFVRPVSVDADRAEGFIDVGIIGKKDSMCHLEVSIMDGPTEVFTREMKVRVDPQKKLSVPFTVPSPRRWSVSDPHLYVVRVKVDQETILVRTGFRSIEVSAEKKFQINGERQYVHGVDMYHDCLIHSAAMTRSDYSKDFELLRNLGANAIHSVVGPHDSCLYDMCDKDGVMAWIDMPMVQSPFFGDLAFFATAKFEENATRQFKEILYQNYNHPSVVMWGLFSTLRGRSEKLLDFLRAKNSLIKKTDPSRPTVACSNQDGDINFISDLIVWRQDVGWDKGSYEDLQEWQNALSQSWGNLRQAVSYGQSGVIGIAPQATAMTSLSDQYRTPEHLQTRFHEEYISRLDENLFWGVWVSSLFDYGSVRYHDNIRNTGLVTFDRLEKKDSFYLYKAFWNHRENTLHIVGKHRPVRRTPEQIIKIYSTIEDPKLTVDGEEMPLSQVSAYVYQTEPFTVPGTVRVEVSAGKLSDSMTLTVGNCLRPL